MEKARLNSHEKAIAPEDMPKNNPQRAMWRCSAEIHAEMRKREVEGHYIPMYIADNAKYFAEHSYQSATYVWRECFGFVTSEEEDLWDRMDYGASISQPLNIEALDFARDLQKIMCTKLKLKDYETAYLLFFSGCSAKQVAEELDLPIQTVYSRRAKIAKILQKHYYEAN